jgi:hypothetical protein
MSDIEKRSRFGQGTTTAAGPVRDPETRRNIEPVKHDVVLDFAAAWRVLGIDPADAIANHLLACSFVAVAPPRHFATRLPMLQALVARLRK